ncbi:hypothetical protein CEXT_385911, partial [Caerostris extrusa]
ALCHPVTKANQRLGSGDVPENPHKARRNFSLRSTRRAIAMES